MRVTGSQGPVSVRIVAGTEVVQIGIDIDENARAGLLGFAIWKKIAAGGDAFRPLLGGRRFPSTTAQPPSAVPLDQGPVQGFLWADYSVDPGTEYAYRVAPVRGTPDALEMGEAVELAVRTEHPDEGVHGVYFNRGVAGSQSFSRQFGAHARFYQVEQYGRRVWQQFVKPDEVPEGKAYEWLSRGLGEAMEAFVRRAVRPADAPADARRLSLRAAFYELTHQPVIRALIDVLDSGGDVRIVHHAKTERTTSLRRDTAAATSVTYEDGRDPVTYGNYEVDVGRAPDGIAAAALRAVGEAGCASEAMLAKFESLLISRADTQIQHNKFIILLEDDRPVEVWTGSTNITAGGIFGQSNVGHVVRDPGVAQAFLEYWQMLAQDPPKRGSAGTGFADWTVGQQPDPTGRPAMGTITPYFSPRTSEALLDWYAEEFGGAQQSVHFTTAFTVASQFLAQAITAPPAGVLRYLLMESNSGRLREPYERMCQIPGNRIAWGDLLGSGELAGSRELPEMLSGLNQHVNYLHTKYMLVDPLTDDPLIVTGSANFSKASTCDNDENMLVVRGDTRLADIYLTEFMRMFRHFETRNLRHGLDAEARRGAADLDPTDGWSAPYFDPADPRCLERELFSGS